MNQDVWATATGKEDGLPLIFRFRMHMPLAVSRISDFPILINVYWSYDGSSNNGMPPPEDNERQIAFEDAITPLDGEEHLAYLMLVVTGNSRKEWIFYAQNFELWLARMNDLLSGHSLYPIQIETNDDPDWAAWRDIAICAQN
ncbi:MAG: DUF695 domain-containing protein [Proteobacteria bacterium]|nr:DUF695 domain-containing protein [Pseudomonadota bacterium]